MLKLILNLLNQFIDQIFPLILGLIALIVGLILRSVVLLKLTHATLGQFLGQSTGRLDLFFERRIGKILIKRAKKMMRKGNRENALTNFNEATGVLKRAIKKYPHSERIRSLLNDPDIAELYCIRAYNHVQNAKYQMPLMTQMRH